MVKAVAGGGGRGMRPVTDAAELAAAFERCASEAKAAFGNGDLYVERLPAARAAHRGADRRRRRRRSATSGTASAACSASGRRWWRSRPADMLPTGPARAAVRGRRCSLGEAARLRGAWAPWSSWSTARPASCSSRAMRACRWSTRSPRRSPASTWCALQLQIAARRDAGRPRPAPGATCRRRAAHAVQVRVNLETMAAGRLGQAGGRAAHRLRAAVGAGRAGRRLRLRRLPHQRPVRQPAGQADRPRRDRRPARAVRQGLPRAVSEFRIEGVGQQHRLPADPAGPAAGGGGRGAHPLHRGAHGRARARAGGPPQALFRRRARGRRRRRARGSAIRSTRSIRWPCWRSASRRPLRLRRMLEHDGAGRDPGAARAAAGHGDRHRGGAGRRGARRPGADDHGSHEDGARDRRRGRRRSCARSPWRSATTVFEGHPLAFLEEAEIDGGGAAARKRPSTWTSSARTWPRCWSATA